MFWEIRILLQKIFIQNETMHLDKGVALTAILFVTDKWLVFQRALETFPIAIVALINVPSMQNVKTITPICLSMSQFVQEEAKLSK